MPAKRRAPASAFLSSPKKAKCESYSPSPSTLDPCVLQLPALAATNPFTNSFRSIDQHQHQHDIHNNDDHQFKHNKGFIPITIETFALVNISLVQQFNNNNLDIILAGDRARPPSSLVVTPTTTTSSSSSSSTPLDPTFHLLQQQNAISIATPLHHHNPKMIESHKKIAPQIVSMRELQIHPTHVNIDERMSHDIIPSPTSATSSSHPTFDNNPYFHPFVPSSPTFDMTHVVINNNYLSGHSFMINTPSLHYSSMTCTLKPLQYRTRAHGTRVIRTGTNSHNHGQPYAYRKRTHTRVIRTNSGLTGEWDHDHNHNSTKPTTIFREIINKSLLVIGQIATAVGYIMTDNIDTDTDTDTDTD